MTRRSRVILKVAVWALCLSPLARLAYRAATDDLTANPISFITNVLGDHTLRLLLASLAMTPRRLLGLFAFFFATLHFSVWLVLDHFFNWHEMGADIVKRPYITVGMTALTLMIPLAATSTAASIRWLGGKNWQRLHALVYVSGICGVLHYRWLAKKAVPDPYYYIAILALLLGVRVWDWSRRRVARLTVPSPQPSPQRGEGA